MKKRQDEFQLDLFEVDPSNKKKSLESIKHIKKNQNSHIQKIKDDKQKELIKYKEQTDRAEWKETVKKINYFLSWGRCTLNKITKESDGRDYFYNQYINKAYITKDHSSEFLKFKFTWELPLFEELYGTVLEEHLEYGIRFDLQSDVLEYEGVIEDCETLCSDGYLEGYDDPLITFHTTEYKIEDIGITDILEKQSISRKNNIVSVYWEFKKIYKNQEIYDVRFNHDTLKQCVYWSGW